MAQAGSSARLKETQELPPKSSWHTEQKRSARLTMAHRVGSRVASPGAWCSAIASQYSLGKFHLRARQYPTSLWEVPKNSASFSPRRKGSPFTESRSILKVSFL